MNQKEINIKNYKGLTLEDFAQARNRHVKVINFLLSGESPAVLVKNKNVVLLHDLVCYIRSGLPNYEMALHDPILFKKLRDRITELILQGWF
ncbi:MAG: hypothetical protein QXZ43_04730 [Candidatus Aenigmatarchaeota archaeon]